MCRHLVGTLVALALGLALIPGTALAAPSGSWGSVTVPKPICNVGNGFRDLYAPVPTIYAANLTSGSGNDRQAVYYWVRAYDYRTGNVLTDWVSGGGAWANDNSPAVFSAQGTFGVSRLPYIGSWYLTGQTVRLQYSFAWYSTAGILLGTNDLVATNYQLWAFGYTQSEGISYAC